MPPTFYAQGFEQVRIASKEYGYGFEPGAIASMWRTGCIIRAALLGDVMAVCRRDPNLVNLLLDEAFRGVIGSRQESWRSVVQTAVGLGIPAMALSVSLA
jgi:6-phosphogluconate dehydrogenase